MKKIFTLFSALLITLVAFSQSEDNDRRGNYQQGKLSISTAYTDGLRIIVDGRTFSNNYNGDSPYDEADLVANVRSGYHNVKIYRQTNGRFNGRKPRSMQLIYEGNVYVKPQYHVDISINRFGRAFTDERQMNAGYYAEYDNDNHDWNNNSYGSMQPMNNRTFDQFRETLRNESFDNSRLSIAKQTIGTNYFTAAQVKELVQLFSFDNTKLDLAKFSYKNTVDKNNYFVLNDAFSFSNSKEELARYIQSYR
ncbi:MAG: DUF4476 domain-containing protein [Ferruginibacter sp.]